MPPGVASAGASGDPMPSTPTTPVRGTDPCLRTQESSPCPSWCERPPDHDWEDDGIGPGEMRCHWCTLSIPDTTCGTVMLLVADYCDATGVQRGATRYVVTTGGDCELDAAGAQGLAATLLKALSTADELDSTVIIQTRSKLRCPANQYTDQAPREKS